MKLFSLFVQEIAIDLGTANTLIIQDGNIVVDEPSIVAIDTRTGQTIAVGNRAMQMHEKTHQFIKTIRPLKDGVIADFQAAENMIEGMINMIGTKRRFFTHLKMVVCIPSGITEVEKRAVFDSADHVDSKETFLIFEPMAAALGIGLDVEFHRPPQVVVAIYYSHDIVARQAIVFKEQTQVGLRRDHPFYCACHRVVGVEGANFGDAQFPMGITDVQRRG